jgi:hypothetical protein
MTLCPCARKWLAEMVEEAMRRRPEGEGARWVLGWLLANATNLPPQIILGIERELARSTFEGRIR